MYNGFDANVSQNAVAFPAATQPNQIDYQFDHCTGGTFTANHDETNDVSRVGGLVQMKFSYQQGGIVAGNTLNGNTTGDGGVTNDADCLDIDSNSNSLEVVGNRCNGSANGFLNNAGSNIWYGPNYVGGMPPSARELISGTAGLLFQQPISNAWLLEIAGGSALFGQTSENPIPDPPPPAVTQFGGAGTTTHTYYIDCMDYNGGYTLASPAATITNSNSTLSATNYNQISWTQNAGCKVWHVMRDGTSGNVLIGTVTGQAGPGATLRLNDSGQAATGYAAATRNNSGDLVVAGRISDTGDGLFASNGIMSASANSGGSNGGAVSGDISLGRTASTAELFFGYGAGSSHLDYGIGTPSAFTFGADVYGAGIVSAGGDIRARNGVLTASANGGGANGGAQPGDLAIGRSASTGKAFFGFGTGSSSIDYNISNANQFTFGADVRSAGNLRADAANGYIMASNGALVASKNGGGSSGGAGAGMLNTAMAAAAGRTIYGNGTGQARIDFGNDYAGQFYFSAPIVNSCAGTVALASGSAAVNNTCLNSSRPVICTEQNTSAPSAIGCAISGTTLNIKSASSSDTSTISWWN